MLITINKDRTVTKSYSESEGSQNENRITELQFAIPEDFDDFLKKIVFITEDGTFWDYIEDDEYIIKNNISKYKEIQAFVWMTNVETQQDFRTHLFDLKFYYNENPDGVTPSEQQISAFDTMMEELQEAIEEVQSLPTLTYAVVQSLPTQDIDIHTIYLLPREDFETSNIYDEYLYVNNTWEKIGSTNVDLTDYVKNTDYASSSKGGVIKNGNGIGISGGGATYAFNYNYDTYLSKDTGLFIGKGTLENVIAGKGLVNKTTLEESQASQDEIIEGLQEKTTNLDIDVDELKNQVYEYENIETESNDITLNDTKEDLSLAVTKINGSISQKTTQGYNIAEIIREPITSNGVTFTPLTDGGIKIQGTLTTGGQYRILTLANIPIVKAGKTYTRIATIKGTLNKNSKYVLISGRNSNGTDIMGDMNIASDTTTYSTSNISSDETMGGITIYSSGDGVVFDCVLYFMLVEGTYSSSNPLAFEKYTGGQASPNPSFESPVKVIDGEYEVEVENKNVFSVKETGYISNLDGSISPQNDSVVSDYIVIPDNSTKIYFYGKDLTIPSNYVYANRLGFYDKNKNWISGQNISGINSSREISIVSGAKYIRASFAKDTEDKMIAYGTATSYVAHQHQTETIDTSPNPLYSANDYYYKSSGKWYVHNEWGKYVFTGEETGSFLFNSDVYLIIFNNLTNQIYKDNTSIVAKSDKFYSIIGSGWQTNEHKINSVFVNANGQIHFTSVDFQTENDFRNYIRNNNVTVIYKLATPTNTKITNATLIAQLDALQRLKQYDEKTIISMNADTTFTLKVEKEAVKVIERIETLEEKNKKLYADHPDIEEEGTDLSINGTGDFDLALSPKGNITQETGTSYNLANFKKINDLDITNGSVDLTQSYSSGFTGNFYIDEITLPAGSYTLGFKTNASTSGLQSGQTLYINGNTEIGSLLYTNAYCYSNFTLSQSTTISSFKAWVPAGALGTFSEIMLLQGTYTTASLPYQPYGQYPSPTNPSPVKVIDGEYEVEVENKNLLSYPYYETNKTENGITFTDNGDGTITLNGTATDSVAFRFRWIDEIIKSGTYTFSSFNDLPTGITIYVWDNWGQIGGKWVALSKGYKSMTVTSEVDINLRSSLSIAGGTILNNVVIKFQIEKGSTATPYQPHADQTKTIDTSPNPLYSANDLYFKAVNGDSFYDSLTSEQKASLDYGYWYVHNEFIEEVFNGTENWVDHYAGSTRRAYRIDVQNSPTDISLSTIGELYSNYFKATNQNEISNSSITVNGKMCYREGNSQLFFRYDDIATVEGFKTWLSTHNTKVVRKLATPTNTEITNTDLINSLEALQNMKAYQDQTNISQTHNEAQADMIINAKTIMSLKYMQKEIENLSSRLALLE